jgi:hypothetical protein
MENCKPRFRIKENFWTINSKKFLLEINNFWENIYHSTRLKDSGQNYSRMPGRGMKKK